MTDTGKERKGKESVFNRLIEDYPVDLKLPNTLEMFIPLLESEFLTEGIDVFPIYQEFVEYYLKLNYYERDREREII